MSNCNVVPRHSFRYRIVDCTFKGTKKEKSWEERMGIWKFYWSLLFGLTIFPIFVRPIRALKPSTKNKMKGVAQSLLEVILGLLFLVFVIELLLIVIALFGLWLKGTAIWIFFMFYGKKIVGANMIAMGFSGIIWAIVFWRIGLHAFNFFRYSLPEYLKVRQRKLCPLAVFQD